MGCSDRQIPATGGYNTYIVQRQGDGTYTVINSAAYAANDAMRHTLYYTQRNQASLSLWKPTPLPDILGTGRTLTTPAQRAHPWASVLLHRNHRSNDNAVLWLDNADYNADILTADKGGTKLVTSGGVETTVVIYKASDAPASEIQYKEPARVYNTDNSGKAANEDSYITTATDGVMKNDRTLGEISISKVDLDAVRYVGGQGSPRHGICQRAGTRRCYAGRCRVRPLCCRGHHPPGRCDRRCGLFQNRGCRWQSHLAHDHP